jgi:hypothetical protein
MKERMLVIATSIARKLPWLNSKNIFLAWLIFFLISAALSFSRSDMPFTSQWDEMYHLSYVQYASQGVIPAWGYPLNDWGKTAFSCYPVSLIGITTPVPCNEIGPGAIYPTGGTNTAALWPPVYYFLTAILMAPIKLIFGITDNLFAARYATALIWAAGTAFLSLIVRVKSKSFVLGLSFSLLATSLSLFGQSASYVSPHSTVPFLLALGIYVAFKLEKEFENLPQKWKSLSLWNRMLTTVSFSAPIILFGALLALTVPHAFPILITLGVYVFVGVLVQFRKHYSRLIGIGALTGIVLGAAAGAFFIANRVWGWQSAIREVPFPPDVNPASADVTALGSYPDLIQQLVALWWDFWPLGLINPWLQGAAAIFIENVWVFFLAALILTALATLGVGHWLFRLSLGLVVTAPIASNLAFSTLQFAIPERYGMAIVLLGLFGIANENLTKIFRGVLLVGAIATYIISFFYSPLPFAPTVCPPGQFSGALGCVLP